MTATGGIDRHDLIRNAVLFLNDPKVQSSSLTSRITFLESKGLDEAEIQEALRQASSSPSSSSIPPVPPDGFQDSARGYGYNYNSGQRRGMFAPDPPRRDWRDLFVRDRFIWNMCVEDGGTLKLKMLDPRLWRSSQEVSYTV